MKWYNASYSEDGEHIRLCVIGSDMFDALNWIKENVKELGITIFGDGFEIERG